jgi:hypothetical protein
MLMKFYATFGQAHTHSVNGVTLDCDCVLEVEANSWKEAYDFCNKMFLGRWSSLYEEPHLEYYPRGIVLSLRTNKTADQTSKVELPPEVAAHAEQCSECQANNHTPLCPVGSEMLADWLIQQLRIISKLSENVGDTPSPQSFAE